MTMSAPPHHQRWFSSDDFRARHAAVFDAIGPSAVAVVQGAGPVGGFEIFRQTNELFHLTGLDVPQAYLLLDGRARRATLYLPPPDAKHAASEGAELSAADGDLLRQLTGVVDVRDFGQLTAALSDATVIHTPLSAAEGNMACQDTLRHAAKLRAGRHVGTTTVARGAVRRTAAGAGAGRRRSRSVACAGADAAAQVAGRGGAASPAPGN